MKNKRPLKVIFPKMEKCASCGKITANFYKWKIKKAVFCLCDLCHQKRISREIREKFIYHFPISTSIGIKHTEE